MFIKAIKIQGKGQNYCQMCLDFNKVNQQMDKAQQSLIIGKQVFQLTIAITGHQM